MFSDWHIFYPILWFCNMFPFSLIGCAPLSSGTLSSPVTLQGERWEYLGHTTTLCSTWPGICRSRNRHNFRKSLLSEMSTVSRVAHVQRTCGHGSHVMTSLEESEYVYQSKGLCRLTAWVSAGSTDMSYMVWKQVALTYNTVYKKLPCTAWRRLPHMA